MQRIMILSKNEIEQLIDMKELIEVMKEAYVLLSKNKAAIPERIHIGSKKHNAVALFMPSYADTISRFGFKFVCVNNDNPKNGLPLIHGFAALVNAKNGELLALMEGSSITAYRTGAGSGAATDIFAKKDAKTAAIFGSGTQAETQLEAVCAIRDIQKAFVYARDIKKLQVFAEKMAEKLRIEVIAADNQQYLDETDIICTATTSNNPVFDERFLKNDIHINAIGSYKPTMCEIPPDAFRNSTVIVDSIKNCLNEAGDIINAIEKGVIKKPDLIEIGDCITAEKKYNIAKKTIFKSVGNAAQDLAASEYLYKKVLRLKAGKYIEL